MGGVWRLPRPRRREGPEGRPSLSRPPAGRRRARCPASHAGGTATPIGVTATDRCRRSAGTAAPPLRGGGRPRSTAGLEGPPRPPQPRPIPRSRPSSGAPPRGGSWTPPGSRGQRRSGKGTDDDRLVRLGEVSPSRAKCEEEVLCSGDAGDWSCHGRVVRVPWLDDRGDGRSNGLGERRQREAVQHDGEGVALRDPLSREDDLAVAAAPTQEELGRVPVAVETEPGTVGPTMPNGPEHGLAAELVEAVGRVDQEDGRGSHGG